MNAPFAAMRDRSRCALVALLLAATLAASGCAADATTTGSTAAQPTSPPATAGATAATRPVKRRPDRHGRPRRRPPAPPTNPRSGPLAYSTASNDVVQTQPAPGSCHAIGTGLYSRPDPTCTPGSLNPAVTQATIDRTICAEGWTATVRPPTQGAECTLISSYSSAYNDYNVYVHSNQPDQTVTVTDAYGHSGTWHTDSSGYADVYFKSGGTASGRRITGRVGHASCSTTL